MFIDSALIEVRSGAGGDGAVSFLRMKYVPKGGPNGGNGGDGGSVVLEADDDVDTLLDFSGRHHWRAKNGEPGGGKQKYGAGADDLIIHVPPGTLVYHAETGELLVDMDQEGMLHVVAKGGRGGFGNEHFKNATNQAPREFTPGGPSVELPLRLELKLIADVGLVGKPNAGKSTLLSAVSSARPKIADYPFTTLVPQPGIAELGAGSNGTPRRLVIADLPGLIEEASAGAGLGARFLRHIERTRLIIHVLEPEPADGSDAADNYRVIRRELEAHSPELAAKTEIVAVSKMDLMGGPEDHEVAKQMLEEQLGKPVLVFSSATRTGLTELLEAAWATLHGGENPIPAWGAADM
ncbi:MAG: GTPase ObgE [Algisphaera sp.]